MTTQLSFHLAPNPLDCAHRSSFVTMACVPAGVFCSDCESLLLQYLPQSPAILGYLSADWAWHYRDGKPWTTL